VLLGRWKTGVYPACFDELAEQGGIRYSFEDTTAIPGRTRWRRKPDPGGSVDPRLRPDEALKPLGPRLEPPRPWWFRWMLLAIFTASVTVVPTLAWLR
jgi:hypothetical protein